MHICELGPRHGQVISAVALSFIVLDPEWNHRAVKGDVFLLQLSGGTAVFRSLNDTWWNDG